MQSVEVKVGKSVFARTSSFGHWAPQRICALAGMLSAKTAAARVARASVFIGLHPRWVYVGTATGADLKTEHPHPGIPFESNRVGSMLARVFDFGGGHGKPPGFG